MPENLFKRIIDIGGLGLARAYDRISGLAPGSPQQSYFSPDITPTAAVLPAPTSWEQFRLTNDRIMRSVNGAPFVRVVIPVNGAPEQLEFNFLDTVAIGEFNEYDFGPPDLDEIWRIFGVNFLINVDASLLVRSTEVIHILSTGGTGIGRPNFFGDFEGLLTANGVFTPGPAVVEVRANPSAWDMFPRNLPGFNAEPFLRIRVTNEDAATALNVSFRIAIVRTNIASSPETPR